VDVAAYVEAVAEPDAISIAAADYAAVGRSPFDRTSVERFMLRLKEHARAHLFQFQTFMF
jgi:hypothetical protein